MAGETRATDGLARRNGASLRDPAGYVFEREGHVYRRLHADAAAVWAAFTATPLARDLMADGRVVPTWFAEHLTPNDCAALDAPGMAAGAASGVVLEHERIPVISHALEWSFSMLRDAALLHLDLMEALLPHGLILKDATPANVQWRGGRPCLIDVASIDRYLSGPWRAYGQFCRTMLFPLMASAHTGLPLTPLVKGHGLDGMPASTAARLLKGRASLRPGVLLHVRLQAWLHTASLAKKAIPANQRQLADHVTTDTVLRMMRGLRRALEALPTPAKTAWTGYRTTSTYTAKQLEDKRTTIDRWCAAGMTRAHTVLDVGCNTGDYSRLLAKHAKQVIGIDADAPCVDELYLAHQDNILPLVVDFSAQTAPAGWALGEQRAFRDRVKPDWSVWLAVIHHLAIHNGVRLDEVVREMANTSRDLIVEFVAPEDEMVLSLMSERNIERPDYSIATFEALLVESGLRTVERSSVTATRTLYLLTKGA
jgi:SAM-dependent methyltransferase